MRSHLYTVVLNNLPRLADVVESCLDEAIKSESFIDPDMPVSAPIDIQVFVSIAGVLHEYANICFFYLLF